MASAGGAVGCWTVATGAPEPCGAGSRDRVVQIACHPRRRLIASGYANGAVAICQPSTPEILLVRGAGSGSVDVLSWSPAGDALAYASDGQLGLVSLPPALFREGGSAP